MWRTLLCLVPFFQILKGVLDISFLFRIAIENSASVVIVFIAKMTFANSGRAMLLPVSPLEEGPGAKEGVDRCPLCSSPMPSHGY